MLSKVTAKLVEEVFGYFGDEDRKKAKKEPEVCLVSLLERIREDLPETCSTLHSTVGDAPGDESLEEARKHLKKAR